MHAKVTQIKYCIINPNSELLLGTDFPCFPSSLSRCIDHGAAGHLGHHINSVCLMFFLTEADWPFVHSGTARGPRPSRGPHERLQEARQGEFVFRMYSPATVVKLRAGKRVGRMAGLHEEQELPKLSH